MNHELFDLNVLSKLFSTKFELSAKAASEARGYSYLAKKSWRKIFTENCH